MHIHGEKKEADDNMTSNITAVPIPIVLSSIIEDVSVLSPADGRDITIDKADDWYPEPVHRSQQCLAPCE
jgi:hypothetical protein